LRTSTARRTMSPLRQASTPAVADRPLSDVRREHVLVRRGRLQRRGRRVHIIGPGLLLLPGRPVSERPECALFPPGTSRAQGVRRRCRYGENYDQRTSCTDRYVGGGGSRAPKGARKPVTKSPRIRARRARRSAASSRARAPRSVASTREHRPRRRAKDRFARACSRSSPTPAFPRRCSFSTVAPALRSPMPVCARPGSSSTLELAWRRISTRR
jgi:hypothetical protein